MISFLIERVKKFRKIRTQNRCADLYAHFHAELGSDSYYPPDAPHISDNRLFGMFHANTAEQGPFFLLVRLRDIIYLRFTWGLAPKGG